MGSGDQLHGSKTHSRITHDMEEVHHGHMMIRTGGWGLHGMYEHSQASRERRVGRGRCHACDDVLPPRVITKYLLPIPLPDPRPAPQTSDRSIT